MSKTRSLRLFTYNMICNMENVISLLKTAGWSVTDESGNIHFWNTKTDEWEIFSGTYKDLIALPKCTFYAYKGEQIVSVSVDGSDSFNVSPSAYIRYVTVGDSLMFDFNWYYDSFYNHINKDKCVIERIVFEEY